MKRYLIAAALGASVLGGVAVAQSGPAAPGPGRGTGGDGTVSRAEFLDQADRRFDRLDYDRDGKVSAETLMALTAQRGPGGMRGRHGMRGHGLRHRGAPDAPPPPQAGSRPGAPGAMPGMAGPAERMKALDTNRDGWIDRAEFRAQAASRFAKLDANNDGQVDAAERAAVWMKLRDARGMDGMQRPGNVPPRPGAE